ncbi:MAG: hypothetical protein QOH58_53 [Thermoleophilaceae bacterium]|jgi:PAS domain S-box-containing protein|nr:hypothetical protein [Thermoleophilaceae bacterium]
MGREDARAEGLKEEAADWTPLVVEAALDAIVTIDETGRVVRFNRAAERMFGYPRAEAIGEQLVDLVIPEDLKAAHLSRLFQLGRGEPPRALDRRMQLRALHKSGEEFPIELIITRTCEAPLLFTGFVRDLTPLRHAEYRGTQVEGLLATAEELALMGSWELDLRTDEAIWSDGMYRIQGFEPGEVSPSIGMYLELIHEEDRERVTHLLTTVAKRPERLLGREVSMEYRSVRPDGAVRDIRVRGRVEADVAGKPLRWVGMAQDVTDQRVTERELHAHYAVSQALRDWESFEEGVVGLLRRLGTALDFPLGCLWTPDSNGRLTCRAFWSAPGVEGGEFEAVTRETSLAPGRGVPGRAWETCQALIIEELSTDPRFLRRAAAAEQGLRSGLAFPAVSEHGPLAVLSFYGFDLRQPSERLLRTLDGIGTELGRFLERRRADLGTRRLSKRELEVLELAAEGNTGPQIAEQLVLGPATVKTHFEHIYEKLGVSDRAAAVAHALRIGLIR